MPDDQFISMVNSYKNVDHPGESQRENGGTLGMVPLIINPIYT